MANTEEDVRSAIVIAIQGVYAALGFKNSPGNIKSYLLEEELADDVSGYLMTELIGEDRKKARAIGVQVYANEDVSRGFSEQVNRFYLVRVRFYYGVYGSTPINTMISAARACRKALIDLGGKLGGAVDSVTSVSPFIPDAGFQDAEGVNEILMTGGFELIAEKYNPDW